MFQTKINKTEEDFKELIDLFRREVSDEYKYMKPDSREWDLSLKYFPSWGCLWNNSDDVMKSCEILMKDDVMALVLFDGERGIQTNDIARHLYRLEDLLVMPEEEDAA